MNFNWQQKGWPNATVDRAALKDGEEGVKAGLSASKWVSMAKVSKRSAERDLAELAYLTSVVSQSRATVKRAVAALVKAGEIEHRGSKKTGGYYAIK